MFIFACKNNSVVLLNHTLRHTHAHAHTHTRQEPLVERSARRRSLYLKITNTTQIFTPPEGFEAMISANERPQTYALEGTVTGIGI